MVNSRAHPDRTHIELLLEVARAYHLEGLTQDDIASRVSFSRPTISRLLEEARQLGIVQVSVQHPLEEVLDLERQLQAKFHLEQVTVASLPSGADSDDAFAGTAAQVVAKACRSARILTVADGLTIMSVVSALPPCGYTGLTVVQMKGFSVAEDADAEGPNIVRHTATKLGGERTLLHSPLLVDSAAQANNLRERGPVSRTLAKAVRADVTLFGIGGMDVPGKPGRLYQPWLSTEHREEAYRRGAVGHISGHHFDEHGQHIPTTFCGRVISIAPQDQRSAIRVCVVRGDDKVEGLRAALSRRIVDVLVTDVHTAHTVLDRSSG